VSNTPVVERPWFREPMVWMMIGLPLCAVVAGTSTLMIALNSGSTDAVPDVVTRTLQIQNANLDADRRAIELGLSGRLTIDAETGAVQVQLDGLESLPPRLKLQLLHAGRASRDLQVPLVRGNDAWHGRVLNAAGQAWNIELSAEDTSWRVGGRLDPGAVDSALAPLLAATR